MSDFGGLPKEHVYIQRIQVENDLSPEGAQILITCQTGDSDAPMYFATPLRSSIVPPVLTLQLLMQAFQSQTRVRVTYKKSDKEKGRAHQLVAVRLERE